MKNQRTLLLIYCVIFCGVITVALLSAMLKLANNQYHATENRRYVSYNLADQLRQSSDDLTRLARTYVVTGNPQYEKMYWDVLDIRAGRKPRPDHYERIYWDLVFHYSDKPRPNVKAVSLRELMKNAGFTETELAMLSEALGNSEALVKTEEIAMNMVKGLYDDGKGNFTERGTPNPDVARQLMYDGAYHLYKASIMKPIAEFQKVIDERTQGEALGMSTRTQELFWALVSTLLILSGASTGAILLRRKQDVLFRESESHHRILVNTIPDLIWLKDTDGVYLSCNKMFGRFFGAQTANILGKTDYDFVDQELADSFREHDRKAMAAAEPTRNEEWIIFADDGHRALLDTVKTPMYDDEGKVVGVLGIGHDITERKESEDKLNEAFVFNQQIINCAQQGIIVYDLELRYRVWNPFMEQLVGLKAADVLGKTPLEAFPFLDGSRLPERFKNILEGKTVDRIESPFHIESTGKSGWCSDISAPLFNATGKIIGIIGIVQNLTEQRTTQAQLIQAQKMDAIGTLAGGIAHDFNNILGAIIGYTEIVRDDLPPESEAVRHLSKVLGASERASALVKQILAFSRQSNIQRIPLQPSAIVKEAIKLLRPSLPSTIAIQQQIDTSSRPILADPTQVHRILMNLCTNAFHAMEQTGGTLEIILKDCELSSKDLKFEPEVQPGKYIMLSIGDTGSGIGPEIRKKIFDPYFTTKEVGKGTGMGLAIAHGIVVSYGGFITCESEIGQGTVFRVFFPAINKAVEAEARPIEVAPLGTERILFVDDEIMLVELGKTMLERLGYEVTAMTSSIGALAIFQNRPDLFDVIITDQTMPGMTGIDFSRKILQIRPEIPIILCTGYSSLVNQEQAKSAGIKGFADKPFTKEVIATLLRKVLAKNNSEN